MNKTVNVYAHCARTDRDLLLKLLEGQRVFLLEHKGLKVYVQLEIDGWYALQDGFNFRFTDEENNYLGGVDQEGGGCVQPPWEEGEEYELQDACWIELDRLFNVSLLTLVQTLTELAENK